MKLLVAIPCHGSWMPEFGHSLALTVADLAANPGPSAIRISRCESSKLASNRMELAKEAIRVEADKILWCDADHSFKPANVRALLAHDLDIVGCNYAKKIPSQESVCSALDGTVLTAKTGIEEVAHIGFGLCVTKTSVFEKLSKPWFAFRWSEEGEEVGEDVHFCRAARAAGIKVHVDHDASVGVAHIGKFPFVVTQ